MKLYHEQEAKGIKKSEIFSVDFAEVEQRGHKADSSRRIGKKLSIYVR